VNIGRNYVTSKLEVERGMGGGRKRLSNEVNYKNGTREGENEGEYEEGCVKNSLDYFLFRSLKLN